MNVAEKVESNAKVDTGKGELDVAIVGAGFAGLYQLHKLREKGFKVKLLEAGSDIGGIWHWNRYPGARVDSHGALYQYSDPGLWKDWAFKELYPDWQELREYFDHVDSKWDLRKDVVLNTRVTGAEFDETSRKWTIHTEGGRDFVARFFVLCTGFAAKPYIPNFKGIDSFRGEIHHTGLWPQEGLDMTGKRVAVIGMGASGVQVVQEAAPEASHLTHFVRTPCLAIPMWQRTMSEADNEKMWREMPADMDLRTKAMLKNYHSDW